MYNYYGIKMLPMSEIKTGWTDFLFRAASVAMGDAIFSICTVIK